MFSSRVFLLVGVASVSLGCTFQVGAVYNSSGASDPPSIDMAMQTGALPSTSDTIDMAMQTGALPSTSDTPDLDVASRPEVPPDMTERTTVDMTERVAPDLGPACTLGTVDHCGHCNVACPGADDSGSQRVCSADDETGQCDVLCLGESYDVDGNLADGCEASGSAAHDTFATGTAITLENVVNVLGKNPVNWHEAILGDGRRHDAAPTLRPNGRDQLFAVTAKGSGDPAASLTACLGIPDLPTNNSYEMCMSDATVTEFDAASCKTIVGMAPHSVCVSPPHGESGDGPYYVRVRKLGGTNSTLGYWLWMNH
jgi:hypothetical protein